MTEFLQYLSVASSLMAFITVFYLAAVKIAKMEVKVDTIWDFMMRSTKAQTVRAGFGEMNSPILFTEEAKNLVLPLGIDLRKFYAEKGYRLTDTELALEVGRVFGERLLTEVCVPHKLYHGTAVLIAAEVAKEGYKNAGK